MKFNEYQEQALTFSILAKEKQLNASSPSYVAKVLGLVGEAGEVAEKYKKIIRDKEGIISEEDRKELLKELGDVLWYVAVISSYLEMPLEEVAQGNIDKLSSRKRRGTQSGSGDNR